MISERLRQLREDKGLNRKEVAQQLNLPYTTYVNYETGAREPGSGNLIAFSRFYNVSIDYILGIVDDREPKGEETLEYLLKGESVNTEADKSKDIFAGKLKSVDLLSPDDVIIRDGKIIRQEEWPEEMKREIESFYQYLKSKYNID